MILKGQHQRCWPSSRREVAGASLNDQCHKWEPAKKIHKSKVLRYVEVKRVGGGSKAEMIVQNVGGYNE